MNKIVGFVILVIAIILIMAGIIIFAETTPTANELVESWRP